MPELSLNQLQAFARSQGGDAMAGKLRTCAERASDAGLTDIEQRETHAADDRKRPFRAP